jgi:SSS family solute:Na+ symporter
MAIIRLKMKKYFIVLLAFPTRMFALAVLTSLATRKNYVAGGTGVVSLDKVNFDTSGSFNILGIGVVVILAALYATWW